jgi:hypothetical protein
LTVIVAIMSNDRPRGDPDGRRLARRRRELLAEAGRLAGALAVLMRRADVDPARCAELGRDLAKLERDELMKARGRIEGRRRFKQKSGHPLHEDREANLLFVDESGIPSPQPGEENSYFTLGAVAMDEGQAATYVVAADRIKAEFFGSTTITFHEPMMRHREDRYYLAGDEARQREFDAAIAGLIESTEFTVFGVAIRKTAFAREFVETGIDPYLPTDVYSIAIQLLLERYVDFLASRPQLPYGRVTFESQGPKEDAMHQREYVEVLLEGTQWVAGSAFQSYLQTGVAFTKKSGSDPMELADMFSRDLFEWVRSDCADSPLRWEAFSRKIYCRGDGAMGKFGVKVFPDSDVRPAIERHRETVCAADETPSEAN